MRERRDWQPDIRIEPLDERRIRVIVQTVEGSTPLPARLFPLDGAPSGTVNLTLSGAIAQAEIVTPAPFEQTLLQLWVEEPAPRRETVTDVSLYVYPDNSLRFSDDEMPILAQRRPCNPCLQIWPRDVPASLDGQAMIYDLDGVFGQVICFRSRLRPVLQHRLRRGQNRLGRDIG